MKILVVILLFASVRCGEDLNNLIADVFGTARKEDCTCVPYYQCNNDTLVTDGAGIIDIRAREGPCENYLEVCCKTLKPDLGEKQPVIRHTSSCGRHNVDGVGFRIVGDENGEAQFGEFPWMVAVLKEEHHEDKKLNVYQCGGALIHPQVVLTAAHCVNSNDGNIKIRAGEWDTQTNNELLPHQDAKVKTILVHPDFYSGALFYDVALLILDSPVTLAENVDVVCLPQPDEIFDQSRCFASGWGKNQFGKDGSYQVILKKLDLPIIPRQLCQEALRKTRLGAHFQLHDSFVCAGGEEGKDTCKGDGGSPLVCPIPGLDGRLAQVGIVSWGIGCGEYGTPGVYANVAYMRDWIDSELSKHNLEHSYYSY